MFPAGEEVNELTLRGAVRISRHLQAGYLAGFQPCVLMRITITRKYHGHFITATPPSPAFPLFRGATCLGNIWTSLRVGKKSQDQVEQGNFI